MLPFAEFRRALGRENVAVSLGRKQKKRYLYCFFFLLVASKLSSSGRSSFLGELARQAATYPNPEPTDRARHNCFAFVEKANDLGKARFLSI